MQIYNEITLRILCSSIKLRGLTICFIDESSPVYNPNPTATWNTDLSDLVSYTGKTWHDEMIVFVPLPTTQSNTVSPWVYPVGVSPPCRVIETPRNGGGGNFIYNHIISIFGKRNNKRDLYVFVDVSGSMDYSTVSSTLSELYSQYSEEFNFIELTCSNERWIRWILNSEMGIPDCV